MRSRRTGARRTERPCSTRPPRSCIAPAPRYLGHGTLVAGALAFGPLNNDGAREVRSSWAAELEASREASRAYLAELCGGGQDDFDDSFWRPGTSLAELCEGYWSPPPSPPPSPSTCGGDGTLCWIGLPIDGDFSAYTKGSKCMIEHKNDCRFSKNKDGTLKNPRPSTALYGYLYGKQEVAKYLQKCQKCACQHGPDSQEFKEAECNKPIPEKMGGPKNKGCDRVDTAFKRLPLNGDWDGDWDCRPVRKKRFLGDACSKMKTARKMFASGKWRKYLNKCQRCACMGNARYGKKEFELGQCNKPVTC